MKDWLKQLLQADIQSLAKILLFFIVIVIIITPGALILFFEGNTNLLSRGIFSLIALSAIISIPFHFLGALTYLSPYKTLQSLIKLSEIDLIVPITLGISIWSIISALVIYFSVHLKFISSYFPGLKERYILCYFVLFGLFSIIISVNLYRISKFIQRRKNS